MNCLTNRLSDFFRKCNWCTRLIFITSDYILVIPKDITYGSARFSAIIVVPSSSRKTILAISQYFEASLFGTGDTKFNLKIRKRMPTLLFNGYQEFN